MKIIYGTTNLNKIVEMTKYFKDYQIDILSLKDIGFTEEIEENGETFLENSMIKAQAVYKFCQEKHISYPILTDDAGLCVHALDDRPGVHTARYAGDHAPQMVCLNKLMEELKDKKDRSATFYCGLTFVYNGEFIQVLGSKDGRIAKKIGKLGGFTFGPVFILKGYRKPYNELSDFETHRHNAVNKLIKILEEKGVINS